MPAVHTTSRMLTPPDPRTLGWQANGHCHNEPPELFFPVGNSGPALDQTEQAKAVCRRCPVRQACLAWAMETLEHGVAGGLSEDERRALRRKRVAARESVAS